MTLRRQHRSPKWPWGTKRSPPPRAVPPVPVALPSYVQDHPADAEPQPKRKSSRGRYRRWLGTSPFPAVARCDPKRVALFELRTVIERAIALEHRHHACPCRRLALAAWLGFTGQRLTDALAVPGDVVVPPTALRLPQELWDVLAFWVNWRRRWGVHEIADAPLFCTIATSPLGSKRRDRPGRPLSIGNAKNAIRELGDKVNLELTPGALSRSEAKDLVEWVARPAKRPKYLRLR